MTTGGIGAALPAGAVVCTDAAAIDHNYTTKMGVPLTVKAPGLLKGDTGTSLQMQTSWHLADPADSASDDTSAWGNATITYGSSPSHQDLAGDFTYTPDPNTPFTGVDEFDYYVVNSCGDTDWDTAYITVTPTIVAASYYKKKNTALHVTVGNGFLAHDTGLDPISMFFDGTSAHGGTITDGNASDGSFTYTPAHNFSGTDSFGFTADDLDGDITYASTVHIQVNVPNAPTGVTATPGNGTAVVKFKAPTLNGGNGLKNYIVIPYIRGAAQKAQTFGVTTTTLTLKGLANGKAYTFKVEAKNAGGTGPLSAASAAIVVGAPGAPSHVAAAAGRGRATIHWSAPGNNGAAITAYVITPYLAGVAKPAKTFPSAATTETITGLAKGGSYTFKVAAHNARGTGPQSSASNAVKPT